MSSNFHLAPPVKVVDGLAAVPMDIQSITAKLIFDGTSASGVGDATVEFITGPADGNPIFDLRQTIIEAWLDSVSIAPAQLSQHNFGGGSLAELRIVEAVLSAGTMHTLRMRYSLGLPQSSTVGSYPPHLEWSTGPRLVFNFGFTDLGPGRYLEAWVPANLIFDQFTLALEIRLVNTVIDHSLITNGTMTVLGINHWQVQWPAGITALSPLLELRPTDSIVNLTDTVTLPVSGTTVTIEAWKLASSPVNLATQVNNIKTFLTSNENDVGTYLHGDRFVAFLHTGGMEYDGGTTTATGPLRHEIFHSWWGRGVKPAGQPDGWWDEAWTVYNMAGATGSLPFNFSDAPVELSTRNPWSRVTPNNAYTAGERFFEGLAALGGVAILGDQMDHFYAEHQGNPVTTENLEEHLLTKIGKATIVDAFHRFVYGFTDPPSTPDLWIKDEPDHTGIDYWGGAFWDSPDLWVRRNDDNGSDHQNPEFGQDNWCYARVRNRSASITARHFVVSFNVKSFAGMQFSYPDDFLPCVAAASGFDLAPGESRIVKARWPKDKVPSAGAHACLLAAVLSRSEHPAFGAHVWEHNNLAQKNLSIVDLFPGDWVVLPFMLSNDIRGWLPWFELRLIRPRGFDHMKSELLHADPTVFTALPLTSNALRQSLPQHHATVKDVEVLDCGGPAGKSKVPFNFEPWTSGNPHASLARRFESVAHRCFQTGRRAAVRVAVPYNDQLLLGWRLHVPKDTPPGSRMRIHLVKRNWLGCKALGGIAVEICVKQRPD